jgi:hypothetical protein
LALDDSLRDVFPESVRRVWDRVGVSGRADVHLHPLAYRCAEIGAPTVWSVGGTLDLLEVALSSVASMEDLRGTVTVEGTLVDRMGGTMLRGELENASLRVFNRVLTDVSTPWSHVQMADGQGRFSMDDVQGRMYDGILTSRTEINFDVQDTRYDVSGAVHGVDIKQFVAAGRESGPVGSKQSEVSGRVDASLTLVGVVGAPPSRKGTGRIEVREGELFRMPLMLAVLNVINLTLPTGRSTDQAEANFFVLGSRLTLDDIRIEGHGLAFVGSGVFSLPDKGLDLNLVHQNPNENIRVPGLSDAVEMAMGKFVALHVTGPLHQPRVVARPLPGISDELKRLFKKKKPKKMQATSR